jgi:hypothetical protein
MSYRRFALILGCCLLFALPANAQTSFPMLGGTLPLGVERGKTTQITLFGAGNGGANLNGAYKVLVEGKGVVAEVVPPEKGFPKPDPKTPWTLPYVDQVAIKVTVEPNAELGIRQFRIATQRAGVSSLGQIIITDEPQVNEAEPNDTLQKAQAISVPMGVNGRIQQGEDVDFFKFKVEAGQELTFAVQCARLEDLVHDLQTHADPLITLYDANGREIARNDDYYKADPLLSHKFEKAGEYVIQIRDVGYQGNPYWFYHLEVTNRPYVTNTVPSAVRSGQTQEVEIGGYHLGGTNKVKVEVPANQPNGIWHTQFKLPNGTTNVVALVVSDLPQTTVAPPPAGNRAVTAALPAPKTLSLPSGVSSWLTQDGQIDRYAFRAKKGESLGFEVTARRLDSIMDSEIKIRDKNGNVYAANDDHFGKDSYLAWSVPNDGDYTVEVRDLTGKSGPTYFYNLSVKRLEQDFSLKMDTDRAMLAPGNRTSWYVILERKHGFSGEVKIEVKGLPAGVSVTPLTIPSNMTVGTLIFTVAPDAKIDASAVEVIGTATATGLEGKPVTRIHTAVPSTEIYMPGGGRGLLSANFPAFGISETNDLEVTTNLKELTLKPGETKKIEVTIKRRPDYTKAVTLDARVQHLGGIFVDPLPPGVTLEDATIPDNQTKGTVTLRVAPNAQQIKGMTLSIFANASINFVMKVWYSAEPIALTIQP